MKQMSGLTGDDLGEMNEQNDISVTWAESHIICKAWFKHHP